MLTQDIGLHNCFLQDSTLEKLDLACTLPACAPDNNLSISWIEATRQLGGSIHTNLAIAMEG